MLFSLRSVSLEDVQSPRLRAIAESAEGEGATGWILSLEDRRPREVLSLPRTRRVVVALAGGRLVSLDAPSNDPHLLAIVIARLPDELRRRRTPRRPRPRGPRSSSTS